MLTSIRFLLKLIKVQMAPGNYDTNFVAEFIGYFNGHSIDTTAAAWAKTSTGRRYLAGESIFDNLSKYKDADSNTFIKEYFSFREKYYFEKLSDHLKIDENIKFQERDALGRAFGRFMVDVHDFTHVLTGYPPDPLGELLRIEYGKNFEGRGWRVLSRLGKIRIFLNGIKEWFSCLPLYKEARQMGKISNNYIFADWFNILGQDINEVRKNLNTFPTTKYHWQNA
mgnify:CR=1 FL=1